MTPHYLHRIVQAFRLSGADLPDCFSSAECAQKFTPIGYIGMMLYAQGPLFSCAC